MEQRTSNKLSCSVVGLGAFPVFSVGFFWMPPRGKFSSMDAMLALL